ncbi:hypothetical protein COH93_00355 [Neisseria meningitidis]|nr:hypothetical protein COH93_00355 [Neisseria meningitidis]
MMMLNRVSIVLFPFGRFYGSGSDSRPFVIPPFRHSAAFRHSHRFRHSHESGNLEPQTRQEFIGND